MFDQLSITTSRNRYSAIGLAVTIILASISMGFVPADISAQSDIQQSQQVEQAAGADQIITAERTIDQSELAPGESTTVSVEIELDGEGDPAIFERFDPNFEDVVLIAANPDPIDLLSGSTIDLFATWEATDTATLEYKVTVPEDAEIGDTFTISGNASTISGEGAPKDRSVAIDGDSQIQIVEPEFDVAITETNSPVEAGEDLDVTADIENTGSLEATQDVTFSFDGTAESTESVTLDGGDSESVTFTFDTTFILAGDYNVEVASDDDRDTETVTLTEAPDEAFFAVEFDGWNSPVEAGENLEVTAHIKNTGDIEATQNITFIFNDTDVSTKSVTLDGGDSETVTFTFDTTGISAGEYEMEVWSDDDGTFGPIIINDAPEEAEYVLSNLDPAEATVTVGDDPIDVSADIDNAGDQTGDQDIELTVTDETTGEVVYSDTEADVALDGGDSVTVTFEDVPAGDLAPGTYTHEVSSEDDSVNGSLTVEEASDAGDGDDSEAGDGGEEFALDEIAQAKYGHNFANLSTETAGEVRPIYNRQPFSEGTDPSDIHTRDEITNDRYGYDFSDVSRETTIEIQNDYDAQFGELPSDPAFTLDEIAQAKHGHDFANLSTETAGEVQTIYNRQPFPEGTDPADIHTRDEITNDRYGYDFSDVSRETTIEIQNDYDAQFEEDS
ncbi:COG1361 S-layer family protein [Halorubrum sp. N11]|uniref:COG1361 S-layer family protein n=1 Tax=Halorubrum sp. N11 TaxID=3402276 RepID=UPI003EBBE725